MLAYCYVLANVSSHVDKVLMFAIESLTAWFNYSGIIRY